MEKAKQDIKRIVDTAETTVKNLERSADKVAAPVRSTLLNRFPVVAVLVIAFGITATTTAAELLYKKIDLFVNHPGVLLVLGLVALLIMGKLHQKLG